MKWSDASSKTVIRASTYSCSYIITYINLSQLISPFDCLTCAATLVQHTALAPFLGLTTSPEAVKQAEKLLMQSLGVIESVWLKGDAKFLLGNPQPSIADLSLVCEIMQLEVCLFPAVAI